MSDLKTFQNIEFYREGSDDCICYSEELKREAVKWVKHFRDPDTVGNRLLKDIKADWIELFFDLSEEDLELSVNGGPEK